MVSSQIFELDAERRGATLVSWWGDFLYQHVSFPIYSHREAEEKKNHMNMVPVILLYIIFIVFIIDALPQSPPPISLLKHSF